MKFDKPSNKLDLAVAKAAGIGAAILGDDVYYCDITDPNHDDFRPSVTNPNGGEKFQPSREWVHATQAAEEVGLFYDGIHSMTQNGNLEWEITRQYNFCGKEIPLPVVLVASTGPLVICKAIIVTYFPAFYMDVG